MGAGFVIYDIFQGVLCAIHWSEESCDYHSPWFLKYLLFFFIACSKYQKTPEQQN